MTYAVKEIFRTLQGEGARSGRVAVFCRFSGCNLWSGREAQRAKAQCRFCDTDFVGTDGPGGGSFTDAETLANAVAGCWKGEGTPYVVFTGGEPLLQLDAPLIEAMHARGFEVAVESNGTIEPPSGIDWLCVSPKASTVLAVRGGSELKLVYPQEGLDPASFLALDFGLFFLQPLDGPGREQSTAATVAYCLEHPRWRLSLQTHKVLRIP